METVSTNDSDINITTRNVALLIDGDNISADYAGRIIMKSLKFGELIIKRVFGNANSVTNWTEATGFRIIHAGDSKNAADILLSMHAVELACNRKIDTFVIVSSDQDFSHIAHHLRERHFSVVGIGQEKAPDGFRNACTTFIEISNISQKQLPIVLSKKLEPLDDKIHSLFFGKPKGYGIKIKNLNSIMRRKYEIKIKSTGAKNWRGHLLSQPDLYVCDPKSQEACVRLK